MKKQLFTLLLTVLSFAIFSQTKSQKFHIYAGFGFQQYSGDLGHGFYKFNSTEYGVVSFGLDYSVNKSFDVKFLGTIGDLGYCQINRNEIVEVVHDGHNHVHAEVHEHGKNPKNENLSSRMVSGILALQYKFANGYILPEDSRIAPFVYLGGGINSLTDIMKMECVVPGIYYTMNFGTGFRYKLTKSFFAGYNLRGLFTQLCQKLKNSIKILIYQN